MCAIYHLFMDNTHLKLVRRLCSQKLSAHGLIARLDRQQQWDFATLVAKKIDKFSIYLNYTLTHTHTHIYTHAHR